MYAAHRFGSRQAGSLPRSHHVRARGRRAWARRLALEALEDRRLLSIDIVWHNRGVTSEEPFIIPGYNGVDLEPDDADTPDNFAFVFGSQAEAAREVVDAALAAWERVITNFNDENNEDNTYTVTIVMDTEDNGAGAHARTPGAGDPSNGIPDEGAIIIEANRDQGVVQWFVDPTPNESSEFMGTLINAFCGNAQSGSLEADLGDLFSVVAHEMTHLLGMSRDEDFLWEDLVEDDSWKIQQSSKPDALWDGDLWVYDAGGVEALFSSHNASEGNSGFPLHIAAPHADNWVQSGSTRYYGARDLGNARYDDGQRCFPSLLLARYLAEVYGYSLASFSRFPNFYTRFDAAGALTVRGGGVGEEIYSAPFPDTGDSNDIITLSGQGDDLVVEVDIGTHVPGTGVTTDFTQHVPISALTSVDVFGYDGVTMSGGDDSITLDFSMGNWCPAGDITVDGGDGYDQLLIQGPPGENHSYEVTGTSVSIDGLSIYYANIDELIIMAEPDSSNNSMQVLGTGDVTKLVLVGSDEVDTVCVVSADSALQDLEIDGLAGADAIDVKNPGSQALLKIDTGPGDDNVVLGVDVGTLDNFAAAKLHWIDGGSGTQDVLLMQDFNTTAPTTYGFDVNLPPDYPAGEGIVSRALLQFFVHRGMDQVTLEAGSGDDTCSIAGTPVDSNLTVIANDGDDAFHVRSDALFPSVNEVRSLVAIHGGVGTNMALVDDTSDGTGDWVTITETTVGAGSNDDFFGYHGQLEYHELDSLTIHATSGSDVIKIESIAQQTETFVGAGRGNDAITLAGPADPDDGSGGDDETWTVDQINSILTVCGELGIDYLTVNDTADTTGDHLTVTDSTVGMDPSDTFFGVDGGLVYETVEQLHFVLGAGNDDVFVQSTHVNTVTFVYGSDGDDDIVVKGIPGTVNEIRNLLSVNGQAGHDTLIVDDGNENLPTVVTVGWNRIGMGTSDDYFNGGGFITYEDLTELTVNVGAGDDTIQVEGTATGTQTTVHTGDGIDLITVEYAGMVDAVRSSLTIDGGGGPTNALSLIDSADTTSDQVTVTLSEVGAAPGDNFFGANGSFTYLNLTQLNLVTGLAEDTINVRSTNPGTKLLLGGGAGDDTFLIDSDGLTTPGGTVDLLSSQVRLYGGLGSNVLVLDDSSDVTGDTVTITPSASPKSGTIGLGAADNYFGAGGHVAYNEFDTVLLRTGDTEPDIINVSPSATLGGTQFSICGNGPSFSDPPRGDRLNLDLLGVSHPTLTVLALGAGMLTSSSHAPMQYIDIEAVAKLTDPTFNLVLDMNVPQLPGNDGVDDQVRAYVGALNAGERSLELVVNGATAFVGVEGAAKSLEYIGSTDADELAIFESDNGLPSFLGSALGSHTNAAFVASGLAPTNVGIHFDGGSGPSTDRLDIALIGPHDVAYFSDTIGVANSGVVNVDHAFTLSFEDLTPLSLTGAGGEFLVDATLLRSMTTMTLSFLGSGVRQVSGDGNFETAAFSGFDRWTIRPPEGVPLNDETPRVVARHIVYNNSVWDGNDAAANSHDDHAIATDKVALLPGGKATYANYTSYSKGINGIMIDIAGLAPPHALSVADFEFRTGNDDDPASWPLLAIDPSLITVAVRPGEGADGSDRVTILLPDGVVKKTWLQVTVKATADTGLAAPDVHYWGNAIGDSGNSRTDTAVNVVDALGVRANPHTLLKPAPIDDAYDFNRDKQVNVQDELIVRANPTTLLTDLNLINLRGGPGGDGEGEGEGDSGGDRNVDRFDRVFVFPSSGLLSGADASVGTERAGSAVGSFLIGVPSLAPPAPRISADAPKSVTESVRLGSRLPYQEHDLPADVSPRTVYLPAETLVAVGRPREDQVDTTTRRLRWMSDHRGRDSDRAVDEALEDLFAEWEQF